MTNTDPSDTPQNLVPLPLKILVYTLFGLLVVAAIAVGSRFVTRNNVQDAQMKQAGTPWTISLDETAGQSVKSSSLDGRVLTLVIAAEGQADRVVLVDTKRGQIIGRIGFGED